MTGDISIWLDQGGKIYRFKAGHRKVFYALVTVCEYLSGFD